MFYYHQGIQRRGLESISNLVARNRRLITLGNGCSKRSQLYLLSVGPCHGVVSKCGGLSRTGAAYNTHFAGKTIEAKHKIERKCLKTGEEHIVTWRVWRRSRSKWVSWSVVFCKRIAVIVRCFCCQGRRPIVCMPNICHAECEVESRNILKSLFITR